MNNPIKKLIGILSTSEKSKLVKLFFITLVLGTLEVAGVASILPFMEMASETDPLSRSSLIAKIYYQFGFSSTQEMLIYFGVAIIILIGITNLIGILATWLQHKYSWSIAHNLSTRLLSKYITKPYNFFLHNNSSKITTYIISEINSLAGGIMVPMIELVSRSIIATFIFILLLIIDIKISIIMFFGLGGAYVIIYLSKQRFLKDIGNHRLEMNLLRYNSLMELLNGIKTVTVYNEQQFFYDRFYNASKEFCEIQPKYNLIMAAPKYILEFLAFGSILVITIVLFVAEGNIQTSVPRLGLYAVAGYRLLPSLQRAFAAAVKIKHNLPILERMWKDLSDYDVNIDVIKAETRKKDFTQSIRFKNLSFTYEGTIKTVLDKLEFSIDKGQKVAFVGTTGSGKTTIADIIAGLFEVKQGSLLVDGLPLKKEDLKAWQNIISYVPQDVFLLDDSVKNNITLSIARGDEEVSELKKVTEMSDIYSFIMDELPEQFKTNIGERGVRLSGGQKQRIGLARALYRNPSILILDEATSALDSVTEKNVIDAINKLPKEITTIIIAHRLSTVKFADKIILLENGNVVDSGTYEELLYSNETFKNMIELN